MAGKGLTIFRRGGHFAVNILFTIIANFSILIKHDRLFFKNSQKKIKFMARHLLLTILFLMAGLLVEAQTSIQGSVTDAESGQPILFGTVALYKNGVLITGTETDFDGYYSITEIDPGTYELEFSYTGYQSLRISDVAVLAGKANKLDAKISAGITMETVVITYTKPLVEQDNTTQGQTLTSEEIKNLPTRNINALAALGAGIASSDEGSAISIRGSRTNATNYYIDGIRVAASSVPKSEIEQLQVITGGVEARYGDVTGGIISITTKGPSERFGGGAELETSEPFDNYGHNLAVLNFSGPIWKKNGETVLGYRIAGQFQQNREDDPPALSVYQANDQTLAELEANPVTLIGATPYPSAESVTNSGINVTDNRPNETRTNYDLVTKIDASLGRNVDFTFSGAYFNTANQFTPGGWNIYNFNNNPTDYNNGFRTNFRIRHRLGTTPGGSADGSQKGAIIQNAAYILQFGYERAKNNRADKTHGDRLFDYGYIGNFDMSWEPSLRLIAEDIGPNADSTLFFFGLADYTRTLNSYTPGTANPVLTRYVHNASDATNFDDFLVQNGFVPSTLSSAWSLYSNVGTVYNANVKGVNDRITFNANTSFELVPGGSGGARHNIQFGLMYEERINRSYSIAPSRLWTVARLHANEHLDGTGLDSSTVAYYIDTVAYIRDNFPQTIDTIPWQIPVYAPNVVTAGSDNLFYKNVREKFGIPLNQYINVDGIDPNDLSLDMFSARELNDSRNILNLNYYGYDYLGNQLEGITFEDFFTTVDENGIRSFPVAAFRPNYQSAFIQDKFTYKDVIFRLGLRVDRFDANTKVLKDLYSLYDIMNAGDFDARFDNTRPGNIGDNFKVYVSSEGGESVQAYRNEDTWYFANGTPANDGTEIFGGGLVFPRYTVDDGTQRDVTNVNFNPDISFEDYKPQINWMPRLAFSFPISDEANFFAHYDVLVQRPPSNTFVSPLTYFYWETGGSGIRNNANLRPERTVDYEVGFQQKLSNSSALKISAYYKELRDMIQSRFILNVPAPVNQYETYDNLDFATVKGFSVAYDLRRTGNVSMNLTYTLQFADGTGSDANTSRGLSSRGVQRTLFPMSYDERHRISGIFDYRYGSGKRYNGPRIGGVDILASTGLNLTTIAVSGRPYTKAEEPLDFGAQGIVGAINGTRLPWNFTLGAQIDKNFNLTKPGAGRSLGLNVYIRVSNLLDRKNTVGVYTFTGSPTDDGYLNSAKGEVFLQAIGSSRNLDSYLDSYQWRLLNPNNYSLPRRMFLGAILDF
jgi:outer membrane receptor protein involved in Fe transport